MIYDSEGNVNVPALKSSGVVLSECETRFPEKLDNVVAFVHEADFFNESPTPRFNKIRKKFFKKFKKKQKKTAETQLTGQDRYLGKF